MYMSESEVKSEVRVKISITLAEGVNSILGLSWKTVINFLLKGWNNSYKTIKHVVIYYLRDKPTLKTSFNRVRNIWYPNSKERLTFFLVLWTSIRSSLLHVGKCFAWLDKLYRLGLFKKISSSSRKAKLHDYLQSKYENCCLASYVSIFQREFNEAKLTDKLFMHVKFLFSKVLTWTFTVVSLHWNAEKEKKEKRAWKTGNNRNFRESP